MNNEDRFNVWFTFKTACDLHYEGELQDSANMSSLLFELIRSMIESDNKLYQLALDHYNEHDEFAGMEFLKLIGHDEIRQK